MRGEYIEDGLKESYIQRLGKPYLKKGKQKYFLDQFAAGAGNELNGKFWNKKSSSRFAFDVYSWMSNDKRIDDMEFEFHLPGLASGGMGPNMDVFVETGNEVIFIESKFSELANLHYIDNKYLSEAYYVNAVYGSRKLNLCQRYYGHEFANEVSQFCYDIEEAMKLNKWHEGIDWFEPKQETCHLVGIILYIMQHKDCLAGKRVKLCNIYYQLEKDEDSKLLGTFEQKVVELIDKIKDQLGNVSLEFKHFSVQEMIKNNSLLSNNITFPDDINRRIESFKELALGKSRIEMK